MYVGRLGGGERLGLGVGDRVMLGTQTFELRAKVDGALEFVLDTHGQQTAREWLEGSGLDEALRDEVRGEMLRLGKAFVAEDDFEGWLGKLLA